MLKTLFNSSKLINKQVFIRFSFFGAAVFVTLFHTSFSAGISASESKVQVQSVEGMAVEPDFAAGANVSGKASRGNSQGIPGVLITAVNTSTGEKYSGVTDAAGIYSLVLPTGVSYLVEATSSGYRFRNTYNFFHTSDKTNANFLGGLLVNARSQPNDFDGDSQPDLTVFRPSEGKWYINQSESGYLRAHNWGLGNDKLVPGDYDGDLVADVAVFRDGFWYIRQSSQDNAMRVEHFGQAGDIPVVGDYDADGRNDFAVFRQGVWHVKSSAAHGTYRTVQFGLAYDVPVSSADFDADWKTDIAVFRDGYWYWLQSSDGAFRAVHFGQAGDVPIIGDFDNDRKSDQAVYRNGIWYILGSRDGFRAVHFGVASDLPVPADYDGDGKTDAAVYRHGTWYLLRSLGGFGAFQFGATNDRPIPAAFVQ